MYSHNQQSPLSHVQDIERNLSPFGQHNDYERFANTCSQNDQPLYLVDMIVNKIRNACQQEQYNPNPQAVQQITQLLCNKAEMGRQLLHQAIQAEQIREQTCQNPMERQIHQQRQQQLVQLLQVKEQIRQLVQQRLMVQNPQQCQQIGQQVIQLATRAQMITQQLLCQSQQYLNQRQGMLGNQSWGQQGLFGQQCSPMSQGLFGQQCSPMSQGLFGQQYSPMSQGLFGQQCSPMSQGLFGQQTSPFQRF